LAISYAQTDHCCAKAWTEEEQNFCTSADFTPESVPTCGKCLFDTQCEGFQEAYEQREDTNMATGLVYCCPDAKRCLDRRVTDENPRGVGCPSDQEVAGCGYGGNCGPRMARDPTYPFNCVDNGCTNANFPATWLVDLSCESSTPETNDEQDQENPSAPQDEIEESEESGSSVEDSPTDGEAITTQQEVEPITTTQQEALTDCTCSSYPQDAEAGQVMCEADDTCVLSRGPCDGAASHCIIKVSPQESTEPAAVDCDVCASEFIQAEGCACMANEDCNVDDLIPQGCGDCGEEAEAACGGAEGEDATEDAETEDAETEEESRTQIADKTSCTSHEDCTNVQTAAGTEIGVTYCYDAGIASGEANGDLKCAGNANDCCSCSDNDSFDQNPDNCPAASDCDNVCSGECDFDTIPDGCEEPTDCAGFNAAVAPGGCCENCLQCVKDALSERLECTTTTAAPAKQVKFSMKIEGMTAEVFEEKKEQVKEGIAKSLNVDPTLVEVAVKEQAEARLRRILSTLELDVTVLTDDENAVTDAISNDSFATTLSDEISQSTDEDVTASDVTDPVVENNPDAIKTITSEEDDDMSTGVLILTIVCIITTILICAYFTWFCCVREDEKSIEKQIEMNTNANRRRGGSKRLSTFMSNPSGGTSV